MAAFNAKDLLEPLAYSGMADFGIPDGVITEPTSAALVAFFESVQGLDTVAEGTSGADVLAQVVNATAELCSGSPSAEQLGNLPPRLFREFAAWLVSEFVNPKG